MYSTREGSTTSAKSRTSIDARLEFKDRKCSRESTSHNSTKPGERNGSPPVRCSDHTFPVELKKPRQRAGSATGRIAFTGLVVLKQYRHAILQTSLSCQSASMSCWTG